MQREKFIEEIFQQSEVLEDTCRKLLEVTSLSDSPNFKLANQLLVEIIDKHIWIWKQYSLICSKI